jgi:hypothetical protein
LGGFFGIREIKGLGVGVRDLLGVAALLGALSGCTVDGALHAYLSEVFPAGSTVEITESCGGTLGLSAAVAVFDVDFAGDAPTPDLTAFSPDDGAWTRQKSLREFAELYESGEGIAAAILYGRDCLGDLRDDANALLAGPVAGLYFRSHNQQVVIVLPDNEPGTGVVFALGR